jgi:hypothetical protein
MTFGRLDAYSDGAAREHEYVVLTAYVVNRGFISFSFFFSDFCSATGQEKSRDDSPRTLIASTARYVEFNSFV